VPGSDNPIEFRLEFSDSTAQPYMWRVWTKGGLRKLAYSETYTTRQGAINAVGAVQAGNVTYATFQGSDKRWYFHIKGRNSEILARSASNYSTEATAKSDADLIKNNAATAPFYDYAKATSPVR
jgi:uncharacterized protein YegP (UPF0339 family)